MADQIPLKVMKDGSDNTCGLAQFTSSDSVAIAAGGTGLTSQGICAFVQPGLYAVGCQVTYLGICAGKADTGVAHDNTYVGHSAGTAATTACRHTIIGSQAGKAITTCSGTVAIGYNAGVAQTFGDFNTYVGTAAGAAVTTASNNTVIGYHAATATICSNNIVIGTCAMVANTQGQDNVAIGLKAGATQVAAGCNNVFVGSCVGAVALCRDNTIIGAKAGIAQTTGVKNVFLGACVGYGVQGGSNNVYVGDQAGLVNTSGNANVFIGNCAGAASTASCCLIIGNGTCEIITGNFNTASLGINAPIYSTLTVGVNDTGYDVKFFGASSGAFMLYDESADTLDVRGATAAGPGVLKLTTGELTNVDGGILGRLEFQAPLDSAGTDAILVGASIWGEADATFSATVNTTDLVFATATSATATEKLRLTSAGVLKINNAYCMPSADGSAGYFLCTDGSGALAFAALTSSPWSTSGCFITVPNACFVGVGTATPAAVLHVEGDQIISDGSGLVIGHSAQIAVGNQLGEFQVHGTSDADGETIHAVYAASALGPVHTFAKSRSASIGGFTIVQDGDSLGQIIWYGADGNDFANWGAAIYANVDGTPGNNDMPGRLTFHTTPDGSAGGIERMRITSAGDVQFRGAQSGSDGSFANLDGYSTTDSSVLSRISFLRNGADNAGGISFHVDDSATLNQAMIIDNTSKVVIGSYNGGVVHKLIVSGTKNSITEPSTGGVSIHDTTSMAIGVGGLLQFTGNYTGTTLTTAATIHATKTTGTNLEYGFDLAFNTRVNGGNNTEKMRLTESGAFLVGKTVQHVGEPGFAVSQSGFTYVGVSGNPVLQWNRFDSTGTVVSIRYGTSEKGTISVDGSNVAYNTSSDYRLKENIVDLTGAVMRLKTLQPRRFNFKVTPDVTKDGFVAHEASTVVPEAVTGTKDATKTISNVIVDADGVDLAEGITESQWISGKDDETYAADTVWHETLTVPDYQGIDQAKLVPLLTAAIQEVTVRLETAEAKITTLEAA